MAFLSGAVLGRALGAADFGKFGGSVSILGYLLILTNLGLDTLGTKLVAESPTCVDRVTRMIRGTRLCLAMLLGTIGAALAVMKGMAPSMVIPLALAAVALAFRDDWLLFALGHTRAVSIGTVVREFSYLALVAGLVMPTKSVSIAALSYLVADGIWAAFTQGALRRLTVVDRWSPGGIAIDLLKKSWPIALTGLMTVTYTRIDTPLIAIMRGPAEAGVYYAGYGVIFAALGLSAPFTRAVMPQMARSRTRSEDGGLSATLRVSLLGSLMGCAVAAAIIPAAGQLLSFVFGASFERGGEALSLLGASLAATFGGTVLQQRMVVDDRQQLLAITAIGAAAANLGLNLLLIPHYGMRGAAIATVASEFFLLFAGLLAYRRAEGMMAHVLAFGWALAALWIGVMAVQRLGLAAWPLRAALSFVIVAVLCSPLLLRMRPLGRS